MGTESPAARATPKVDAGFEPGLLDNTALGASFPRPQVLDRQKPDEAEIFYKSI